MSINKYFDWKLVCPDVTVNYNSLREDYTLGWLNKDKTVTISEPHAGLDLSLLLYKNYRLELSKNDDDLYEARLYGPKWERIERLFSEKIEDAINNIILLYNKIK